MLLYIDLYLGVPSVFERGVKSMTPSGLWQTQVFVLPEAGGHFVPEGSAEVSETATSRQSTALDATVLRIVV